MTRILGIDPGSRTTGYGLVETDGNHRCLADGVIRSPKGTLAERLARIHAGLTEVIAEFSPDEVAVERVFVHRNADSALKLGQARGAALVACVSAGLPVAEYAPTLVKQAVVGAGRADKRQVAFMVRALLRLRATPLEDAADALAIAICHAHLRNAATRAAAGGAG